MTGLRSLGEIATRTGMLTVACSRCERRGRYRLDKLIARHGAEVGARVIAPEITADCPHRDAPALMERCDILFPALAALFRAPLRTRHGRAVISAAATQPARPALPDR